MTWIGWIILGALAGMVAKAIMHEEGGFIKNVVVGIIGAMLGGGIMQILGGQGANDFTIYSFLVAVLGAIILIWLVRVVTGRREA